ncbi:hypothetical protein EBR96_00385 [bacterium]|nr:hypothetical protein [bacterium]
MQNWRKITLWTAVSLYAVLIPLITIPRLGLSWDEPFQRYYGQALVGWYSGKDPAIFSNSERYYGPLVPEILMLPEVFGISDSQVIYEIRHWMTWGIFLLGLGFLFGLTSNITKSRRLALTAVVVTGTTMPIVGHALFNSKDIPFMTATIIMVWGIMHYFSTPKIRTALISAVTIAIAILCRVNAVGMAAVLLVAGVLYHPREVIGHLKHIALMGLVVTVITVIFWPILWFYPIDEFTTALTLMSNYPWEGTVLFKGAYESATQLPWTYIPTWIGITIQPLAVVGIIVGTATRLLNWGRKPRLPEWPTAVLLIWLLLPLGSIWLTNAALYDGWRHLYFIFPPLVIISIIGIDQMITQLNPSGSQTIRYAIRTLYLSWAFVTAIQYFPYVHLYMNQFAGDAKTVRYFYEQDYWGVSYRELLESLLASTTGPIRVAAANFPGVMNREMLTPQQKDRVIYVETQSDAEYWITNFRWAPHEPRLPIAAAINGPNGLIAAAYRINYTDRNPTKEVPK